MITNIFIKTHWRRTKLWKFGLAWARNRKLELWAGSMKWSSFLRNRGSEKARTMRPVWAETRVWCLKFCSVVGSRKKLSFLLYHLRIVRWRLSEALPRNEELSFRMIPTLRAWYLQSTRDNYGKLVVMQLEGAQMHRQLSNPIIWVPLPGKPWVSYFDSNMDMML